MVKDFFIHIYTKFQYIILYGIIGVCCSLFDLAIFSLLCKGMSYLVANIISTHCGIFCSFFLNRHFNFKVKDKTRQRFLSFYTVGLLGLGMSEFLLYLFVQKVAMGELLSKLIAVLVVAIVQFLLNKYITFRYIKHG